MSQNLILKKRRRLKQRLLSHRLRSPQFLLMKNHLILKALMKKSLKKLTNYLKNLKNHLKIILLYLPLKKKQRKELLLFVQKPKSWMDRLLCLQKKLIYLSLKRLKKSQLLLLLLKLKVKRKEKEFLQNLILLDLIKVEKTLLQRLSLLLSKSKSRLEKTWLSYKVEVRTKELS